jgi:hypothetical protein
MNSKVAYKSPSLLYTILTIKNVSKPKNKIVSCISNRKIFFSEILTRLNLWLI